MAEKLEYAGDYLIEKLELVTSAGVVVDLRSLYLGLTLYEDLFSLTVTGTLTIHDSTNLTSLGPIIGQEYLHIKIRTPFDNTDGSTTIDFSENAFIVHSVVKREAVGAKLCIQSKDSCKKAPKITKKDANPFRIWIPALAYLTPDPAQMNSFGSSD